MAFSLAFALLWVLGAQGASAVAAPTGGDVEGPNTPAAELHVCPAGPPTCGYASIQAAVDAAGDGDVIKVAAGTYTDVHARSGFTQVAYLDKPLTIEGGYTTSDWTTPDPVANPTTLDAQGQGRGLYVDSNGVTIEGLRITGGDATVGGCTGPPYAPCWGGGVMAWSTQFTLTNNVVVGNKADAGGGVGAFGGAVNGNIITGNTARMGGGVVVGGITSLGGNIVVSNTASWPGPGGLGGGILIDGGEDVTLINNVIADNHVSEGGSSGGSGVFVAGVRARMIHNSVINNHGGDGSGISVDEFFGDCGVASLALTNTLVASQSVGMNIGCIVPETVAVNGVLWHATPVTVSMVPTASVSVETQHTGDPAFAADGYHLTRPSEAIDRGVVTAVDTDIDGDPRPLNYGFDLGADEYDGDLIRPEVVGREPAPEATDVAVDAAIVITFSESIDTGSFAYTVAPDPGGWSAVWSAGDTVVTLSHLDFARGTVYTVTVSAADDLGGNPLADAPVAWAFTTEQEAPAITSADSTTFVAGMPGSFTVTATGVPTPGIDLDGALPAGVTFTDHGDGTASLAGTPAAGATGEYPLMVTASNGVPPDATQAFTLTVEARIYLPLLVRNTG